MPDPQTPVDEPAPQAVAEADQPEPGAPHPDGTAALGLMRRYGVRPSPLNFTLWYEYVRGRHPALKADIDALIDRGEPFTEALGNELHLRHLAVRQPEGPEAVARLRESLEEMAEWLAQSHDAPPSDAEGMGEEPVIWSDETIARADREALARLVQRLRGDLEAAARHRDRVSTHIARAAERVAALVGIVTAESETLAGRNAAFASELRETRQAVGALERRLAVATVEGATDGLTGLPNRKEFDRALDAAIRTATVTGAPLCLVLADIDHFKRFNDTFGHPVGDQVLRLVARELSENVKSTDTTARYGGEEFAILMPGVEAPGAALIIERLRATLAKRTLVRRATRETIGQVTLSFGLTAWRDEDAASLVARADQALYRAKRTGRNRLETA